MERTQFLMRASMAMVAAAAACGFQRPGRARR